MKLLFWCAAYMAFLLTLDSCSYVKTREELLSRGEWIVYTTYKDSSLKSNHALQYYKKEDAQLVMHFHKNGHVTVCTDKYRAAVDTTWTWADPEKSSICIKDLAQYGNFRVEKLDEDILRLSRYDAVSRDKQCWTFRHQAGDWQDDKVDKLNKAS